MECLECLGGVGDEVAIVVEVLRAGRDGGLGLDGALERFDGHFWVHLERQEIGLLALWPRHGHGDLPGRFGETRLSARDTKTRDK